MHTTQTEVIESIHSVTAQVKGAGVGCGLTWGYDCEKGYTFDMWKALPVGMTTHSLRADVTPVERLLAHWAGFVENQK